MPGAAWHTFRAAMRLAQYYETGSGEFLFGTSLQAVKSGQKQTSIWMLDAANQRSIMLICTTFDHGQIPHFSHSLESSSI
jgi:hypothetical protein